MRTSVKNNVFSSSVVSRAVNAVKRSCSRIRQNSGIAVKPSCSRIRQNSGIAGDTTEARRLRLPSQHRKCVIQNASRRCLAVIALSLMWLLGTSAPRAAASGLKLGEICRLKGQEVNTLQGVGLVVGLRGTGDPDSAPTARALAQMMKNMGAPMGQGPTGGLNLDDVEDARNVAMVFVTARVPGVGAQAGDLIDVSVNAIGAKSLEGGTLMLTPLLGPRADNKTVYAMARGPLNLSLDGPVTTATIQGGAKMEATVRASFQLNGRITFVLDRDFASFDTAQNHRRRNQQFFPRFFPEQR